MKILVIGASGYVGQRLCALLSRRHRVFGTFRASSPPALAEAALRLDVRDRAAVDEAFSAVRPDAVFYLAYDVSDPSGSIVTGANNAVSAWEKFSPRTPLVFLSTDVVFDGEHPPYHEDAPADPVVFYGRAKITAEQRVLAAGGRVARTSLVYGFDPPDPRTRLLFESLISGRHPYPYFEDEVRSPVFVDDLCAALYEMATAPAGFPRLLHVAGPEPMSRFSLARALAKWRGHDPGGVPRARLSASPVKRPRDLSLDTSRAARVLSTRIRSLAEVLSRP